MAAPRPATPDARPSLAGARVLVVEARFYDDIGEALWQGCKAALEAAGCVFDRHAVDGALEIPPAIAILTQAAADAGRPFDAAVALGCIIRGETYHFEIVAGESARALMDLSVARLLPLGNGILTVDTDAQAWVRARADELDKGGGAARAALAVLALKRGAGR
jgi:6,7-dimethyl-8-ribityllumazine synthase